VRVYCGGDYLLLTPDLSAAPWDDKDDRRLLSNGLFVEILLAALIISVVFAGVQADSGDLAGYYGFEEMEIVKLDWGIMGLRVVDFNGDGRNDIAVVNNRKAKIELLIQKSAIGPGETEVAVDANDVDINAITPPTRFAREGIAVSQKIYSLVCGDLNSDGLPDLAFYGEPAGGRERTSRSTMVLYSAAGLYVRT